MTSLPYVDHFLFHSDRESFRTFFWRSLNSGATQWTALEWTGLVALAAAITAAGLCLRRRLVDDPERALLPLARVASLGWLASVAGLYPFGRSRHCFYLLAAGSVCLMPKRNRGDGEES